MQWKTHGERCGRVLGCIGVGHDGMMSRRRLVDACALRAFDLAGHVAVPRAVRHCSLGVWNTSADAWRGAVTSCSAWCSMKR